MGLNTTHDCWNGPYSSFNQWRCALAVAAGVPLMKVPLSGTSKEIDMPDTAQMPRGVLREFFEHSDCDGSIAWRDCELLADELERLLPKMPDLPHRWRSRTAQFIDGLREAASLEEDVEFH